MCEAKETPLRRQRKVTSGSTGRTAEGNTSA